MVCSICYDSLFNAETDNDDATGPNAWQRGVTDNRPATLNCGHAFHKSCIHGWFNTSHRKNCPTCHAHQTNAPIVLFIDIDKDDLPDNLEPDSTERSKNDEIVDNIAECLDRMAIGDWPTLHGTRGGDFRASLLERIEGLQAELSHLSGRNMELEQARSELTGRCGRLEVNLSTQKNNCVRLELDLEAQKEMCDKLEADLKAQKECVAKTEADLKASEEQCTSLTKLRNSLDSRCTGLKKNIDEQKCKFETSQKKLAETETELYDMTKVLAEEKARTNKIQRKNNQLNAKINSLKSHISMSQNS
ncbi:hypothetical protein IWW43_000996 [Coemansia sp. RSA 1935]|nr:hypothetical protein J3F82_002074 [Coemansia sp. RSA 637]KAJ2536269.1 hypothetical protein IWW43_000996 [Coemansia sp. RSA 1935]